MLKWFIIDETRGTEYAEEIKNCGTENDAISAGVAAFGRLAETDKKHCGEFSVVLADEDTDGNIDWQGFVKQEIDIIVEYYAGELVNDYFDTIGDDELVVIADYKEEAIKEAAETLNDWANGYNRLKGWNMSADTVRKIADRAYEIFRQELIGE